MKKLAIFSLSLLCCYAIGNAQRVRRDPLTDAETNQLRETAQEPEKRLKLFVKFAKARLLAVEQTRADPKMAKDRGERIHDLLEDFTNIVDELDDNLDDYNHRNADLRKPLKDVIEGDTEFQLKLRHLKSATENDPQAAAESKDYEFVLENAVEAVNNSLQSSRSLLGEQNEKFAKKKK